MAEFLPVSTAVEDARLRAIIMLQFGFFRYWFTSMSFLLFMIVSIAHSMLLQKSSTESGTMPTKFNIVTRLIKLIEKEAWPTLPVDVKDEIYEVLADSQ